MGSRDRKEFREWACNCFRIGNCLPHESVETRAGIANFICQTTQRFYKQELITELTGLPPEDCQKNLNEKLEIIRNKWPAFLLDDVFPKSTEISDRIDKNGFLKSHFSQPALWIRVRRQFLEMFLQQLPDRNDNYLQDEDIPNAFRFPNGTDLSGLPGADKGWFEVQDYCSQKTADYFDGKNTERWWDACAGSGGKSLALADRIPGIYLFASDIRPAILKNLHSRFQRAGIVNYQTDVLDLTLPASIPDTSFDSIIADVPCSGSGTWGRTPENLRPIHSGNGLHGFLELQRNIIKNLTDCLKQAGKLYYITCSVWKAENESNISYFENELPLTAEKSMYFEGYNRNADTLFLCLLRKKSNS